MTTQVAIDFPQNLKPGDLVLVCHEDGEVYEAGVISGYQSGQKTIWANVDRSLKVFSTKTGKLRGGLLFLQPYDDERYKAYLAEVAELHEEIQGRLKAWDTEKRDGLKTAILSVADMIDDANLDGLSTSDLQALMAILNKLGE